jgi:hypothetical protein
MKKLSLLTIVTALGLGLGGCGLANKDPLQGLGTHAIQTYFSTPQFLAPQVPVWPDSQLEDILVRLSSLSLPGSEQHAALYKFDSPRLTAAFAEAQSRGAQVRIVMDDSANDSGYTLARDLLIRSLGKDRVHICKKDGCIGRENNHNKFYLFSEIQHPKDSSKTLKHVVVETSANMKFSHKFLFNTLRIYSGDENLYKAVLQYWQDLRTEKYIPDYLGGPNGKVQGASLNNVSLYFFPSASGEPMVEEVMPRISCEQGGEVLVAQSILKGKRGKRIIAQANRLRQEGCYVGMIVRANENSNQYAQELHKYPGIDVFFTPFVHSKDVAIRASRVVNGVAIPFSMVCGGSLNGHDDSVINDELLACITGQKEFFNYRRYWKTMKKASLPIARKVSHTEMAVNSLPLSDQM